VAMSFTQNMDAATCDISYAKTLSEIDRSVRDPVNRKGIMGDRDILRNRMVCDLLNRVCQRKESDSLT